MNDSLTTKTSGFAMVEVLIALVLFGTVLIGLLTLHQRSLMLAREAYWLNQAGIIGRNLSERLKINTHLAAHYQNAALWQQAHSQNCYSRSCSDNQSASASITAIKRMASEQLPQVQIGPRSCYGPSVPNADCIALSWLDTPIDACQQHPNSCLLIRLDL